MNVGSDHTVTIETNDADGSVDFTIDDTAHGTAGSVDAAAEAAFDYGGDE